MKFLLPSLRLLAFLVAQAATVYSNAAVLVIGHRGNSLHAPENTIAALRACSNKAEMVEFDVRVSKDGHLVLMHDWNVDRTTDGNGAVSNLTLVEIKALDAGSWFSTNFVGEKVPTLEEALTNVLQFATPLVERKAGPAPKFVETFRRLGAVTNILLQSFDWAFLAEVHALEPRIRLSALGNEDLTEAKLREIIKTGARIVAWERSKLDGAQIELVQRAGLKVFVWTVDDPHEIERFIRLGVDGIISNDPATVMRVRAQLTVRPAAVGE
ncbi:MAG: glycerophosphodiester phosphodiesterase family protein [Verrucomicrobiae bacterium]|nr:glycerophosphodiester phosphodiesterase family protein [Verrucomicrobiae bacterium]